MIVLTDDNVNEIRQYIVGITRFVANYNWLTDAYVSDFFFKDHWSNLPQSWQQSLCQIQTDGLADILTHKQITTDSSIPPLSLLCFQACCQNLSLKRHQETNVQVAIGKLTDAACSSNQKTESEAAPVQPTDVSGQLHAYFRKHVKAKKQHEITNLGKVIWRLSKERSCGRVVDVGSGLGHLARLLAFGHGLHVTSIEASDTHAPKATKYDREIDREIKKKMEMFGDRVTYPNHVTSMIYPNMPTAQFLAILDTAKKADEQREATGESETDDGDRDWKKASLLGKQRNKSGTQISTLPESEDFKQNKEQCKSEINSKSVTIETSDQNMKRCLVCDSKTYKRHSGENLESAIETKVSKSDSHTSNIHMNQRLANNEVHSDMSNICTDQSKLQEHSNQSIEHLRNSIYNQNRSNLISGSTSEQYDISTCIADIPNNGNKDKHANKCDMRGNTGFSMKRDTEFILTGLHACGDLTPTVLRFFVNCDAAVGLASVGCCYMKLTDDRSVTDPPGFPMSEFVSGLPHHHQSYVARELACHFADTYYQRLKADSSHLKIHSYRAALEWLAHRLNTAFQRSSVQIPAKKTSTMDFESYARLGLKKLGISCDRLTPELLDQAVAMTTRWREVVAFYTLRLALAPVVESLVLLDRMMFLYEKGHGSALVPIFDPSLSPRNFVLLSCKKS